MSDETIIILTIISDILGLLAPLIAVGVKYLAGKIRGVIAESESNVVIDYGFAVENVTYTPQSREPLFKCVKLDGRDDQVFTIPDGRFYVGSWSQPQEIRP